MCSKLIVFNVLFELLFASFMRSNPLNTRIPNTVSQSPETSLSLTNNEFSFKIFKKLSKEGNNDVMSPLSINIAFSILMNGAENETLDDLRRFLEYNNSLYSVSESTINEGFKSIIQKYKTSPSPRVFHDQFEFGENPAKLLIANRFYRSKAIELSPNYEKTVKQYFLADIQSADFKNNAVEETKKVNEWVKSATNNKITKIFDEIKEDTSFVIINALHFQGQWFGSFHKSQTKKLDFYNNGVTAVKTDTMFNTKKYNYYDSNEIDSQILELEYFGKGSDKSKFTFVVILPKQRNGLKALKQKLNAKNLKIALNSMSDQFLEIYLPKFKVETEYDLIKDISPKPHFLTRAAKFSRLTSEPNIIGEVKHKVYIDVNEKGTEAAAVTAVTGLSRKGQSLPLERPKTFRADHPFLYFIRDRSNGLILFMGQIDKF